MSEIDLVKEANPSTPATNFGRLFFDTDKMLAQIDDAGLVTRFGGYFRSVMDYGAKGDGTTDDTTAIQNALNNGSLPVFFPTGHYKITASLQLPATFCGAFGPGKEGAAYIEPSAVTFPAIINKVGDYGGNWIIAWLHINYGIATGNVVSANTAARGFEITGATFAPSGYHIESCRVDYAYYGYYDTSVSNLVTIDGMTAFTCNTGFLKNNSTTFIFNRCFANTCSTGWDMNGVIDATLNSCAVQSCTVGGMSFQNCHGLTINGVDYEANAFAGNDRRMFLFLNCQGFVMNGVRGSGNTFATGGGGNLQYVVYLNSASKGVISGCSFGADGTDTATGATGTVHTIFTDATLNQVSFIGCDIKACTVGTGSPTVTCASINNTAGQVIVFENCLTSGTITDAGNKAVYLPDVNGTVTLVGSTATVPALKIPAGTVLTAPAAGVIEADGTAFYSTNDTTNGRRFDDAWHFFKLTANGSGITTIADYFGTNDGIPTVLNGVYEIEWHCYLTTSGTAATATWTIVNTQTVTNMVAEWTGNVITGIAATGAVSMAGVITQTAASVALPVTGTLSNASHIYVVHALIEAATAGNVRLRLTMGASGTGTPLRGSYFKVRRLAAGNVGTYVA